MKERLRSRPMAPSAIQIPCHLSHRRCCRFFFGERRHPGGRIGHPAESSSGEDADFTELAMLPKNLRQDAGDSRQDGGARVPGMGMD